MQITFRFRLKNKHSKELNRQAKAVNIVWNFCNETQQKAARSHRKWLSYFDLQKLTTGAYEELDIHSQTIQRVCRIYDDSRKTHKKPWLRWRGDKSLGWIPFNTGCVTFDGKTFKFRGVSYQTMHLRNELWAGIKIGAGSFNADSRGRWYLNIPVEMECAKSTPLSRVGIDLGLDALATLSTGEKIKAPRFYRDSEEKLAKAQRARKKRQIRKIHEKIANRRKDFLHKLSNKITNEHGLIFVGDVSPLKIAQTTLAKSVFDAGWSDFKRMLSYKAIRHGGSMFEVSEHYTSQVCSCCGSLNCASRPKGIASLGIRAWTCSNCGAVHDRDVNAAKNILARGLASLAEGALA